MESDFAVFILTHGRPDNIKTLATLKKCGYTGKIYSVVDNEDKTLEKYIIQYGEESVKIFNKKEIADRVDEGNNFDERRTITHARNACFQIAKEIGVEYFIELDDDYTSFDYRLYINEKVMPGHIKNLNKYFENMLAYYKSCDFKSIAFSQGGDFIGGLFNGKDIYRFSKRKCMNSFMCSTRRPFQFVGAMNEDVNTYTTLGSRGDVFLTIPFVSLTQTATQSQKSGITDMYLRYGTYCKAFTTVMMQPSSVKISMMRSSNPRIHHSIKWQNTTPMILDEKNKKNNPKSPLASNQTQSSLKTQ
jgi:hypothetical protein